MFVFLTYTTFDTDKAKIYTQFLASLQEAIAFGDKGMTSIPF